MVVPVVLYATDKRGDMSKVEIVHEREVIIRKVARVVDKRFKSGYRKIETVAYSHVIIPPTEPGTSLSLDHIYSDGNKYKRSMAHADVTFKMDTMEHDI